MKTRASVTAIEVTVEYQGLPVLDFDKALIRRAERLGGRSWESGFSIARAWRGIYFSFKRMDSAKEFVREVQRLAKESPGSKCGLCGGHARRKKGQ